MPKDLHRLTDIRPGSGTLRATVSGLSMPAHTQEIQWL